MTSPTLSPLEAFDLVRFSEQLLERLIAVQTEYGNKRSIGATEKAWLAQAVELVEAARQPSQGILDRVRVLPELADVREEFSVVLQWGFVDALEKLHAGLTFHLGSRDPIIEAIFPAPNFPKLRRAPRDLVAAAKADFDRRIKAGYVSRMFGQESFAFVQPVLAQIAETFEKWQSSFAGETIPEDQAAALRDELLALGRGLDVATRQARLLAEAALAPVEGAFDASGLTLKPKKRAPKAAEPEVKAAKAEDAEPAPEPAAEPAPEAAGEPEKKPKRKKKAAEAAPQ